MNLATSNRLVTNQISGSTSTFNTVVGHSFSGSLAVFHRISGSTGTYNLIDSDRVTVADLSGSTATFNVVSGSSTTFHKLSGSFASIRNLTVDHISARTFNSSVTTEQHLEIKNRQIIAAVSQSAGVSSEGAGLQIGGTAGTGSSGIASIILGDAGGGAGTDLLFKIGSTQAVSISTTGGRKNDAIVFGISGSISGSIGVLQELEVNRGIRSQTFSGSTATVNTISGSGVTAHHLSASTSTFNFINVDRAQVADISGSSVKAHTITSDKGIITSLTSSGGVTLGSATSDDIAIHGGIITNLYPQNNNKVDLGFSMNKWKDLYIGGVARLNQIELPDGTVTAGSTEINLLDGSVANEVVGGTAVIYGLAGQITGSSVRAGVVSGSTFNVQTLNVYGEISGSGTNTLIKKRHIHKNIIQNNSDSHGGLSFDSGRLSVGWRKKIYVRSDGSNISGSVPTKGMFATDAMTTPYTTASLGSKPMSGSLMVYLNGVLLHGDHPGENPDGPTSTDYRVNTGSANAHVVLLHEDLSLDSDDILTITFLSGSGVNS